MQTGGRRGGFSAAVILGSMLSLSGCAKLTPPALAPGDDPLNVIYTARYGSLTGGSRSVLPASTYRAKWFFLARWEPPRTLPAPGKVQGSVTQAMLLPPADRMVRVMVTFVDTVAMPAFPQLSPVAARVDTNSKNLTSINAVALTIADLRTRREARYGLDTLTLKSYGARILDTFWIIQAVLAEMPLNQVVPLSLRPEVVYVRLDPGPEAPHHDGVPGNDPSAARAFMGSDPYYDLGPRGGYLALLDTGVRTTHRLLSAPSSLCMVADCYSGAGMSLTADRCGMAPGLGDTYAAGHGTASAAILVGNGADLPPPGAGSNQQSGQSQSSGTPAPGGNFRGVTSAWLDSYQVYDDQGDVSAGAVVRGFEKARERLNHVIVAVMQDTTAEMAEVARAADNAYVSGAVVIAANGNDAIDAHSGFPARGRRVIGVGCYQLQFDSYTEGQAWGGPSDGRPKPDLLAPSFTETAGNSDDYSHKYYGGTSGAAPYAGGVALLLRNWIFGQSLASTVDPGQVYAHLILAGDEVGPFRSYSRRGAGRIKLPPAGTGKWGKVWVSESTLPVDVPIEIPAADGIRKIAAAIWWPEETPAPGGDTHNDVDLEIVSPGLLGTVRAKSNGGKGVFERAAITSEQPLSGKWILRIKSFKHRTPGAQVVYWAAALTP